MYTWLLFDADGTLFDFDRAEAAALEHTFADLNLGFASDTLATYKELNEALWKAFERGEVSQATIKTKRFADLLAAVKLEADVAAMSQHYTRHLANGQYLLEEALETVQALAEKCRMMIITNGLQEVQRPRFSSSVLMPYFQDLLVSGELGVAKPAPEIFDIAFERMGQPAKTEVLMIGDSLSSDIQGGVNYGIDTCWFNPSAKANPRALPIRHEISQLGELLTIV